MLNNIIPHEKIVDPGQDADRSPEDQIYTHAYEDGIETVPPKGKDHGGVFGEYPGVLQGPCGGVDIPYTAAYHGDPVSEEQDQGNAEDDLKGCEDDPEHPVKPHHADYAAGGAGHIRRRLWS